MLVEDAVSKMLEQVHRTAEGFSGKDYFAFLESLIEELNMDKNCLEDEMDHRGEEL